MMMMLIGTEAKWLAGHRSTWSKQRRRRRAAARWRLQWTGQTVWVGIQWRPPRDRCCCRCPGQALSVAIQQYYAVVLSQSPQQPPPPPTVNNRIRLTVTAENCCLLV